jgi:catechol 2,3-dioxygenase
MNEPELHPDVRIGHVNLRVADLERATAFYRDVLGFTVTAYGPDFGLPGAAFLAAGGYHHHIGLNTWRSEGGTPPPEGHTGLHHLAVLYPDRRELARAVRRLLDHSHPIDGAEDHGATVSVYLSDPDGNGLELYYDRPREEWFDPQGNPILKAEPFDPRDLLADRGYSPRSFLTGADRGEQFADRTSVENKALVRRVIKEFLNSADPELTDELFSLDYVDHNPSNPGMSGLENVKRSVANWHRAFPDTVNEVQDLLAEGDRVAARWVTCGTQRGESLGIPATGNRIEVTSSGVFRIEGGKVAESWDHFDALGMLAQLGATLGPKGQTT